MIGTETGIEGRSQGRGLGLSRRGSHRQGPSRKNRFGRRPVHGESRVPVQRKVSRLGDVGRRSEVGTPGEVGGAPSPARVRPGRRVAGEVSEEQW